MEKYYIIGLVRKKAATSAVGLRQLKKSRRPYGEELESVAEEVRLGRPISNR